MKLKIKNKNIRRKSDKLEHNISIEEPSLLEKRLKSCNISDCDLSSPFCKIDVENDFQHVIISHLSFRVNSDPPHIIDNFFSIQGRYYDSNTNIKSFASIDDFFNNHKDYFEKCDILIHRINHKCQFKNSFISSKIETYQDSWKSMEFQESFEIFKNEPQNKISKIIENLKKDENYEKAKRNFRNTFKPKPIIDLECEDL